LAACPDALPAVCRTLLPDGKRRRSQFRAPGQLGGQLCFVMGRAVAHALARPVEPVLEMVALAELPVVQQVVQLLVQLDV